MRAPAKPPEREEAPSLDFTQPGEMPKRSLGRIEVNEASHQIPVAIEQAAVLFSAEQTDAACAPLEAAIHAEDLGQHVRRAWGMLFELYQLLGRRTEFDQLSIEFAARFETSPPTWAGAGETTSARRPGGAATVALATLNADKVQEAIGQLFKQAEKTSTVRLSLSKVVGVDEDGCALLNEALRQLKRNGKECVLVGADKTVTLLAGKAVAGVRENEQAWLLLLELLQQMGDQETFDEVAVNYAITFEVSPPSWRPGQGIAATAVAVDGEPDLATTADEVAPGAYTLEGDIVSGMDDAFAAIGEGASAGHDVSVDVRRVRRMDFVAAANLMNLATRLAAGGTRIRLVGASHLLAALWEVIGLDRVAAIELRKG